MPYRIYFYCSERGQRQVRNFLRELPRKHRLKCVDYLRRVRERGTRLPSNIVKHPEEELWEVRPEYAGNECRFLFFIQADWIGVVDAFAKKKPKMDSRTLNRALRLANEMRQERQP